MSYIFVCLRILIFILIFVLRLPLLILSTLYWAIINLKNYFYNTQIRKTYKLSKPVISVGNITLGGTGKTPVVLEILNHFENSCVLTRGYKSEVTKQKLYPAFVPDGLNPKKFGDEPSLIKLKNPKSQVVIDPIRFRGGQFALKHNPQIDVFVLDDGFQHRRLHRDLDIAVFDMDIYSNLNFLYRNLSLFLIFPFGKFREPLSSLKRANFILLSKWAYLNSKHLDEKVIELKKINPNVYFADSKIYEIKNSKEQTFTQGPVILFSGIGRPEFFERDVRNAFIGLVVMEHVTFSDHYDYQNKDITSLIDKAIKNKSKLICTEKDFIKIKNLNPNLDLDLIYVAHQKMTLPENLLNKILDIKKL